MKLIRHSGIIPVSYQTIRLYLVSEWKYFNFPFLGKRKMADHKVDDGLKKEIEAGKTLKDTPVPETGVNTHDATLAGENHYPRTQVPKYASTQLLKYSSTQYPSI